MLKYLPTLSFTMRLNKCCKSRWRWNLWHLSYLSVYDSQTIPIALAAYIGRKPVRAITELPQQSQLITDY